MTGALSLWPFNISNIQVTLQLLSGDFNCSELLADFSTSYSKGKRGNHFYTQTIHFYSTNDLHLYAVHNPSVAQNSKSRLSAEGSF